MGFRSDIKIAAAIKEVNGSTGASTNRYARAIYHSVKEQFVIVGGNGVIYSLDGISNKVQQAPSIVGAALPNLIQLIQDYRSGNQTIVGDLVSVAIDDGNLDNWVIGGIGVNNECLFTLNGDANLYKLEENISFSNDNFVADSTLGVTVFNFPGVNVIAQTANGNRVVCAHSEEIGFIDAGQDPNIAVNWGVIVNNMTISALTQMAINDAGTLVVMAAQRGDLLTWVPGAATTNLISAANNPFVNNLTVAGQANISAVVYSAFWGGFFIYNAAGTQVGFIDESNPSVVDSGLFLGFTAVGSQGNARGTPISAANPAGEIIVCPDLVAHQLLIVSPP